MKMKLAVLSAILAATVSRPCVALDNLLPIVTLENGTLSFTNASVPLNRFVLQNDPAFLRLRSASTSELSNAIIRLDNTMARVEDDMRDLSEKIDNLNSELNEKINEVAALSAALDFQRPAPGKNYRVFTGFGQFQGKTAIGVGVTGVFRDFDYGIGASFSANQILTKGSVGWSF